eukprot:Opistho-2@85993
MLLSVCTNSDRKRCTVLGKGVVKATKQLQRLCRIRLNCCNFNVLCAKHPRVRCRSPCKVINRKCVLPYCLCLRILFGHRDALCTPRRRARNRQTILSAIHNRITNRQAYASEAIQCICPLGCPQLVRIHCLDSVFKAEKGVGKLSASLVQFSELNVRVRFHWFAGRDENKTHRVDQQALRILASLLPVAHIREKDDEARGVGVHRIHHALVDCGCLRQRRERRHKLATTQQASPLGSKRKCDLIPIVIFELILANLGGFCETSGRLHVGSRRRKLLSLVEFLRSDHEAGQIARLCAGLVPAPIGAR